MTRGIEHLEKIRKLKGFSQQYMAGQLHISQNAYSKIERQETKKISAKTLTAICEVLEIEITTLENFDPFQAIKQLADSDLNATLLLQILTSLEKVTMLYESVIVEKDKRLRELEYTISALTKK